MLLPKELKKKLEEKNLADVFKKLTSSRQKEILRYLNHIKTEAVLMKNIDKVINVLKGKASSPLFRLK